MTKYSIDYCPDCIEPLIPNKKKLGNNCKWFICQKCGMRIKPSSAFYTLQELGRFLDKKDKLNLNKNQFNEE